MTDTTSQSCGFYSPVHSLVSIVEEWMVERCDGAFQTGLSKTAPRPNKVTSNTNVLEENFRDFFRDSFASQKGLFIHAWWHINTNMLFLLLELFCLTQVGRSQAILVKSIIILGKVHSRPALWHSLTHLPFEACQANWFSKDMPWVTCLCLFFSAEGYYVALFSLPNGTESVLNK